MLLWFVFWLWGNYWTAAPHPWALIGNNLFLFVLFFLIGWRVFGAPLHG